jgi:BCD family chlorophyll transporter-like MFS transporter
MHMTQTAGLALAADRACDATRPRVVALLYVMYLIGMVFSAIILGWLLRDFSALLLVQVVQGTAVVTMILNFIALWKQEKMAPMTRAERAAPRPFFRDAWRDFAAGGDAGRLLVVVFLGTMAFNMQDVLLEPYGGEILGLSVSATTLLTAMWAMGALAGFALAARWLRAGVQAPGMAARGILAGIAAFTCVVFAAPLGSSGVFSSVSAAASLPSPR